MKELNSQELLKLYLAKKESEDTKRGGQYITCGSCKKKTLLKNWYYVEKYWYEDCPYTPRYVLSDETSLICPKCGILNRFLDIESTAYDKIISYHGPYAKEYKYYSEYSGSYFTDMMDRKCEAPFNRYVNL
jgi:hypothetical protein